MESNETEKKFLTALSVEGERAEWTLRNYRSVITRLRIHCKKSPCDITTDDVRDFLGTFSKVTARQYRLRLKSFFQWLHAQEIIKDDPMLKIMSSGATTRELLAEDQWLTVDESERLKKHADTPQARATLEFALDTGCRRQSLVSPVQFDMAECKATVKEKRHQGGRLVYFRLQTADHLLNAQAAGVETWPYYTEKSLADMLRATAKRAGIEKKVTPITLRHTFACHCRLMGLKIEDLKDAMGHSDISTTMIYANVGQTEQGKAYRKMWESEKAPAAAPPAQEPEA